MKNTVTIESIEEKIVSTSYTILPDTTMTICVITLANGFKVIGEASCVDPANFDEKIGQEISRKRAIDKIWPLEGYLLAQRTNIP